MEKTLTRSQRKAVPTASVVMIYYPDSNDRDVYIGLRVRSDSSDPSQRTHIGMETRLTYPESSFLDNPQMRVSKLTVALSTVLEKHKGLSPSYATKAYEYTKNIVALPFSSISVHIDNSSSLIIDTQFSNSKSAHIAMISNADNELEDDTVFSFYQNRKCLATGSGEIEDVVKDVNDLVSNR